MIIHTYNIPDLVDPESRLEVGSSEDIEFSEEIVPEILMGSSVSISLPSTVEGVFAIAKYSVASVASPLLKGKNMEQSSLRVKVFFKVGKTL